MKGRQLALGVQLADNADFDSYFAGPNAQTLTALRAYPQGAAGNGVLLYGAPGTGKTHLLQALIRESAARGVGVAYLPLRELGKDAAAACSGLHSRALVCVDDLDAALDDDATLELLRLIDARRAARSHLVLAAAAAPERLALRPPDLRTRLAACTLLALKPLRDAERAQLLRTRAKARGLEIADDALRWLLAQLPRDAASLIAALERLDQASLAAQRRLTLPFVQQIVMPLLQHEPEL